MSDQVAGPLPACIDEILPENIFIDTKVVKCFLCDRVFVAGDESFLLFNERIQSDGSSECPLAQILSSVLDVDVNESTAHSSLLCSACNEIVLEYENVEQKLFNVRLRIITAYSSTTLRLQECEVVDEEQHYLPEDAIIEKVGDDSNHNITDVVNENSHDLAEEVIDAKFSVVANVFDSFEMIGEPAAELHKDVRFFAVDASLDFDDNKDTENIIYEDTQSSSESAIPEEQNTLGMENDGSDSIENIYTNGEMDEISQNSIILEEQNEVFSCSICDDSTYWDAKSFSQHMFSAHKLRVYPCDLCNSTFQRKQELNEHVTQEHSAELEAIKYECEVCNRVFDNYRYYRAHKRSAHNAVNKFECQECHKKYSCKTLLEEHMNVHYGLRPFSCEQCPKKFASKYSLQMHIKTHGDRERPYKCEECGKSFLTIQNLHHHKKIHSEKLFICEICQKPFATQHNLDAHSIIHSGKRPFSCRTCGKSFARRAEVIDHERIHTGDRPFKCDICEMAFTQRSNLTAHKKTTHFNEKQHECEICKRSFKRRRLLDYHRQAVHTGERPYKCETCSSSFVYPEHYKKHLRIHTGLKPFECEVCGKRFSSRDNRNAHRFVHSDKKPYECVECGAGFMRKPLLLAHMKHSKHVNDMIIVNQPQISGGKVKTATFAVQSKDASMKECELPQISDEKSLTAEEDVNVCESVSLEQILPSGPDSNLSNLEKTANEHEYIVHKGTVRTTKPEEIDDGKYLQFDDFDAGNHQTLCWVDLAEVKD